MNKYEIMFIVKADIAEEEVANVVKSFESIITDMGGKILNSKDLGIPQHRERIFGIGFREQTSFSFPRPIPLNHVMQDFLEEFRF